jgi:thiol-disulfide isomerase/thioredoxin
MTSVLTELMVNPMDYSTYRETVDKLYAEGRASSTEPGDEHMLHYVQLNVTRMRRLDKTTKLSDESLQSLANLDKNLLWVVVTEGWCGDASQIVPVIELLAQHSGGKIKTQYYFRDENLPLIDQFLTNGGRAIPKVISLNPDTMEVVGSWGPRPEDAQALVNEYKKAIAEAPGSVSFDEVKEQLQRWYNEDKTMSTQRELIATLVN